MVLLLSFVIAISISNDVKATSKGIVSSSDCEIFPDKNCVSNINYFQAVDVKNAF